MENISKEKEYVKELFSAITPAYDLLNTILSMGLDKKWRRFVIDSSGISEKSMVLDLCTGTGELAAGFAGKIGSGGMVVGMDFCPGMIGKAKLKFPQKEYPSLSFVEGDVYSIPYPDNYFDCITAAFGVRNLEDPGKAFVEIRRAAKPGGRIIILELTRPANPLLKALYFPYLNVFLPLLGGLVSGSFGAYRYLARTISDFLSPEEVKGLMEGAGLKKIKIIPLSGGIATVHIGIK
ncbi:MAG: bifunctional demethylmenaquinone methyltransferase/2-methoxy-6-polyprenyl-1,4-benzoquinol methylase UbiE [Firmicutes bacterium]|nr:bifunctional demethylmenaquinone methyltransferase/2-methoxy-6-polyprenyl-1,4-benzoquinol methylase UbiE [Bacillota bacterium]